MVIAYPFVMIVLSGAACSLCKSWSFLYKSSQLLISILSSTMYLLGLLASYKSINTVLKVLSTLLAVVHILVFVPLISLTISVEPDNEKQHWQGQGQDLISADDGEKC